MRSPLSLSLYFWLSSQREIPRDHAATRRCSQAAFSFASHPSLGIFISIAVFLRCYLPTPSRWPAAAAFHPLRFLSTRGWPGPGLPRSNDVPRILPPYSPGRRFAFDANDVPSRSSTNQPTNQPTPGRLIFSTGRSVPASRLHPRQVGGGGRRNFFPLNSSTPRSRYIIF